MKGYTCPICGKEDVDIKQYHEDYYLVEEHIKCNRCNYYYEFCYGYYQVCFGNDEFNWSYSIDDNKRATLFKRLAKRQFMARRNWHKGIRNKYKKNMKGNE